jgi:hypothetical protein
MWSDPKTKNENMKKQYETVTANLNADGSPSIIAWRGKTFDTIPLSDGKGGTIARVVPADALHLEICRITLTPA